MEKETIERKSFTRWLTDPEMLVALSALVLSVCGLSVALYEASLMRRAYSAAVWPHVEVAASMTDSDVRIIVRNTGVGPALVRAAVVRKSGERLDGWAGLLQTATGGPSNGLEYYFSLINGRVLPANGSEIIFAVEQNGTPEAEGAIRELQRSITQGTLDVGVCYCSVYQECRMTSLQDLMGRFREGETIREPRAMDTCAGEESSGI